MQNTEYGSMQREAQRRVYDMQKRAREALGRTANEAEPEHVGVKESEYAVARQSEPQSCRKAGDTASPEAERLLLLLLALLVLRSGRGSPALVAALLWLCL